MRCPTLISLICKREFLVAEIALAACNQLVACPKPSNLGSCGTKDIGLGTWSPARLANRMAKCKGQNAELQSKHQQGQHTCPFLGKD